MSMTDEEKVARALAAFDGLLWTTATEVEKGHYLLQAGIVLKRLDLPRIRREAREAMREEAKVEELASEFRRAARMWTAGEDHPIHQWVAQKQISLDDVATAIEFLGYTAAIRALDGEPST